MFSKIFKSDYIYQLSFIILISIALLIKSLIFDFKGIVYDNSPLMFILNQIIGENRTVSIILNFSIVITEALLLKYLFTSNDLLSRKSQLPVFMYIIFSFGFVDLNTLNPLLFANLLLTVTVYHIFIIFNKSESYTRVLNMGAILAISTMFYLPSIIFFILIIFSFFIFGIFKWREWVICFIGFFMPFFIYFSLNFLFDNLDNIINTYLFFFKSIKFQIVKVSNPLLFLMIIAGLCFLISLLKTLSRLTEKSIYYRKKVFVLFVFSICGMLSFFFPSRLLIDHLLFLVIPFSFFISSFLNQIKKTYISEIFYLILIISIVYKMIEVD